MSESGAAAVWAGRTQDGYSDAAERQQRQRHPHPGAWERDGWFSDRDQPGDPLGAGCRIPEGEHGAERVADDRGSVEFQRVEDVLDQLVCTLADLAPPIGGGI